jgi:lipopolysaccharide transport system ATP-binding protein
MDTVIQVESLGKKYLIRHEVLRYATLRDTLAQSVRTAGRRLWPGAGEIAVSREEFWALRDVSFQVRQGDRLGIIGRNGAGKSTLLKIISRITEPTTGRIKIRGRVASLLEVGTGFHLELTGRENIFLNGAVLGMSKGEIKKKFDEIVDFAEVEKFLDTPVKRYSSGMYVRLAFAVAAHLEPEILIVDEVLAVGDSRFQKKCLGKMAEVGREGRTILFVSHNMAAVSNLCNRACLLAKGSLQVSGSSSEVIRQYLQSQGDAGTACQLFAGESAPGDSQVRLRAVRVKGEDGRTRALYNLDESIDLEIEFSVLEPINGYHTIVDVYTIDGVHAFRTSTQYRQDCREGSYRPGTYVARCRIPSFVLNTGTFYLNVMGKSANRRRFSFSAENAVQWELSELGHAGNFERRPGVFGPHFDWWVSGIDGFRRAGE